LQSLKTKAHHLIKGWGRPSAKDDSGCLSDGLYCRRMPIQIVSGSAIKQIEPSKAERNVRTARTTTLQSLGTRLHRLETDYDTLASALDSITQTWQDVSIRHEFWDSFNKLAF
jgi:hypothetical protein